MQPSPPSSGSELSACSSRLVWLLLREAPAVAHIFRTAGERELTPRCHAPGLSLPAQPDLDSLSIICHLFYIILLATDELSCRCRSAPPPPQFHFDIGVSSL